MQQPVTIIINGKQAFKGTVKVDKQFIVENFKANADRKALWVNAVRVKVE